MLVHFRTRTRIPFQSSINNNPFSSILLDPLCKRKKRSEKLPQILNPTSLAMAAIQPPPASSSTRRPTCPFCSKPSRFCLCVRIKNPSLQNSISVTILQHSLEKKHPLNSTRIATLGLQSVAVTCVSDVNIEARFSIRLMEPELGRTTSTAFGGYQNRSKSRDFDQAAASEGTPKAVDDQIDSSRSPSGSAEDSIFGRFLEHPKEENVKSVYACNGNCKESSVSEVVDESKRIRLEMDSPRADEPIITFGIAKYGLITSLTGGCIGPETRPEKPYHDQLLSSPMAIDALSKGFVVKKIQNGGSEEFEIAVPAGSVLLFPSEKSVGIQEMNDFQVKNLIVLDGTWAKAKRMYKENPWLKLLPHLKLEVEKMSLYGEVRSQPRDGCLSTIESIVYALRALGDESADGLDDLLEVFGSMVGDQRRCKKEGLSKAL